MDHHSTHFLNFRFFTLKNVIYFLKFDLLVDFRERETDEERNSDLLFHVFMH